MSGYRQDLTCSLGASQREQKERDEMASESDEQLQQLADAAFREYQSDKCSDGGPAFPVEESYEKGVGKYIPGTCGMTLLDYFAGQALANTAIAHRDLGNIETAEVCYRQAAAMLKERERINAKRD